VTLNEIRQKVKEGKYHGSFTHTEKIRRRRIGVREIEEAISKGEIIEDYPRDHRGPSCLILGFTHEGRPLHVVCGKAEEEIIIAYEPQPAEWEEDLRTRRR
jgi:hypothetical protein